ncbi:MAG TPA: GtrA family protein [Xanthobacteraceae bacterium]|nr:GtrA family protein [Xanthobacteraceae bacterium]
MPLPLPLENLRTRLTDAWQRRAVSLKALSFATVGLVNTAVDATVFFLMLGFVTSSLVVANVSAWLIAVTGSYVMNSFTTFSAETGGRLRLKDYAGFVGSGLVAVTATTITVVLAANYLPIWAAKGVAILVSFVVNFSITHFVVFRARPDAAGEPR